MNSQIFRSFNISYIVCFAVVNGKLRCLGPSQRLKLRFGNGFEVNIRTQLPSAAALMRVANALSQAGVLPDVGSTAMGPFHVSAGESPKDDDEVLERLTAVALKAPLHNYCVALGKPLRSQIIAPNRDGSMLHDQLQSEGQVSLRMFADWWLAEDYAEALHAFMEREFTAPILLERSTAHNFRFRIMDVEMPLSELFGRFENHVAALNIKDYSIGQTTLEQIFNQFAASQDNPEIEAQQLMLARSRGTAN